jgi:hypothetical protein
MSSPTSNAAKNVMQAIGVIGIAGIVLVVLHKGHADISLLAEQYAGKEFWTRLARYLLANLAGG